MNGAKGVIAFNYVTPLRLWVQLFLESFLYVLQAKLLVDYRYLSPTTSHRFL